ncbi:RsfA family transcriptional regulator [Schinkia azotoformans]|nr:RsfA family transcriptional regulator [Schinkia azotoformans]MEC1697490.1 RsfA family transcriptional regulator [Schinkia azotoformans]MEC1714379.1 RsfA family transcriptional regulator [Schinkia azotoformans]MEC1724542.1 RsfA family transcriptional regulator [Schinkia azotoformans]MEC1741206.1 RsfA family transcriptional regulator [Schinkia azotoformans]MEC1744027.1 RsfA family transcriptional regulator [Schinkia azotoformans]
MMIQRQDAWSEEDDLLLAETVLRHIREGSTQLNAFEEVGDKLNRTSAACGFRWNAVVRQDYMKAIDLAKKQRKQRQRALGEKTKPLYTPPDPTFSFEVSEEIMVEKDAGNEEAAVVTNTITPERSYMQSSKALSMDDVILFLSNLKNSDHQSTNMQQKNDRLKMENKELADEIAILKKQLEQTEREFQTIQEDYQALVKIMDRARKMVLFEDEEKPTNTFKMDKNGNLERIAK